MLDLGLQDVHVLISGANGGIGLTTARLFLGMVGLAEATDAAEQGAKVTALYNTTCDAIDGDLALSDARQRGRLAPVQCDVNDEDAVRKAFDIAAKQMGDVVKVLVVNHAIYIDEPSPLARMTLQQFRRTHDVNLVGSFLLLRSFLQGLEQAVEEGKSLGDTVSVVLVGSTAGEFGEANHADYASSKSALTHGLMLSLKNEIVKIHPGGRINTVAPGWVSTPMAAKSMADPAVKYQALATTPLRKIATPEDVALQIALLASQMISGHVTGQIVRVHGGMEGRLLNPKE